jgi:hypothetical protein
MWLCLCAKKNKSGAIFQESRVSITERSLNPAVAGQYDAGRPDVILLRIEHQK